MLFLKFVFNFGPSSDIDECKEKLACQCAECKCKNTWGSYDCSCSANLLYMHEHDTCISKFRSCQFNENILVMVDIWFLIYLALVKVVKFHNMMSLDNRLVFICDVSDISMF